MTATFRHIEVLDTDARLTVLLLPSQIDDHVADDLLAELLELMAVTME